MLKGDLAWLVHTYYDNVLKSSKRKEKQTTRVCCEHQWHNSTLLITLSSVILSTHDKILLQRYISRTKETLSNNKAPVRDRHSREIECKSMKEKSSKIELFVWTSLALCIRLCYSCYNRREKESSSDFNNFSAFCEK